MDTARAEKFVSRMTTLMNEGMVSVLVSMGHELGLFDTLDGMQSSTSEQIATASGLTERYVREWLGGMVAGGVVEYADGKYRLPPEHAQVLTRTAGADNFAAFVHSTALLADRRHEVLDAFRRGGGVPYDRYDDFMALWAGLNAAKFKRALLGQLPQAIPNVDDKLAAGSDVLEIGCGEGHATNVMAAAYPNSRFVGFDLRENAIEVASQNARDLGATNAEFHVCDLATLDSTASWDLITGFDVIHDQAKPREVLSIVRQSLRPGGTFLMVDIHANSDVGENRSHPAGPFLYGTSLLHCMTVSLAYDGEGLGAVWGEQKARELLTDAGFTRIEVKQLEGDPLNAFYVARV